MTSAVSKSPVQSIQAPHLLTDTDLTSGELQALIATGFQSQECAARLRSKLDRAIDRTTV